MDKEFFFLPGDQDTLEGNLELKNGNAALLFIQGVRKRQNDALWAAIQDGVLFMCSSDGAGEGEESGEMAKWVVEFGAWSMKRQLSTSGYVDVQRTQEAIKDKINERNSTHRGQATGLCIVIDGKIVELNRVGDPDTRLDSEIFPAADLFPEINQFGNFRHWLAQQAAGLSDLDRLAEIARQRNSMLFNPPNGSGRTLINVHTGYDTNVCEASITPTVTSLSIKLGSKFVGGTDGLENVRMHDWHQNALQAAYNATHYMTRLWAALEASRGENASGVAFFCDK